jgi:LPXTG-motif cell wall-anchored protein
MMDGSTLLTIAMMVMMGGMIAGGVWAFARRRRNRDR